MERGSYVKHTYAYRKDDGSIQEIGLVIQKDKRPIYTLTSELNTVNTDICRRRSKGEIIVIIRPITVIEYNNNTLYPVCGMHVYRSCMQIVQTCIVYSYLQFCLDIPRYLQDNINNKMLHILLCTIILFEMIILRK